ncbi:hypothetical protein [Endozoicomonas euniceicola]|uniref:Uncharacterized protein n=1 Tax=Endozoicomonas euniceicola TaxID=1234143 RepID=A0ABY6GZG4_9GAMM|nr:hypothetical protein [Endozoicomonas euniceicola]UYM18200.1 hypothetical protein NX720_09935 [Endozoicomonas euniceicola]
MTQQLRESVCEKMGIGLKDQAGCDEVHIVTGHRGKASLSGFLGLLSG